MRMKKVLALLVVTLTALMILCSCGDDANEQEKEKTPDTLSANVKVVAQESAAGTSLFKNMGDSYELTTYKKIGNVRDAIKDGKFDAAVLSSGIAAEMYEKTNGDLMQISPLSIGGIHIVANGYNKDSFGLSTLQRKNVVIMGKNSTADQVLQYAMAKQNLGFSSVKTKYVNSYEAAEKAFASWGAIVVCSEPYASRLTKLSEVNKVYDLNQEYNEITGQDLPCETLVCSKKMFKERPDDIIVMINDYEKAFEASKNSGKKTYSKLVFYAKSNRGEMLLRDYNEMMENEMKYYSVQ